MNDIYQHGACVGSGRHHLFFSERPADLFEAQQICSGCPVRLRCLGYALEDAVDWGVWGGVIFWEGRPYHRRRGRGRPRRDEHAQPLEADRDELWAEVRSA